MKNLVFLLGAALVVWFSIYAPLLWEALSGTLRIR